MPHQLRLVLQLDRPPPRHGPGVGLHGLVFGAVAQLERLYPELAKKLHDAQTNPFSLALTEHQGFGGYKNPKLQFRLNILDEALLVPLSRALPVGLPIGEPGEYLHGHIQSGVLVSESYHDMLLQAHQGTAPTTLTLYFKSPTAFSTGGRGSSVAQPLPGPIFNGLARRFQLCSGYELGGDYKEWFETHVGVEEQQIEPASQRLNQHETLNGFVGQVRFGLAGEEEGRRMVGLLARFAQWSGVGLKTGFGCGEVVLEN